MIIRRPTGVETDEKKRISAGPPVLKRMRRMIIRRPAGVETDEK